MLYQALKLLMEGTIKVFFHSISIKNKNLIPNEGPLIILANHPSMFMDPIVIASVVKRKVSFLAKGVLFNGILAKWILPKLGLIPVHRAQDNPSELGKNAGTFKKCFEHLEKGGALLIFPEGVSSSERKLQSIKSGAARIAIGAEARNDFKLGLKIVVVGLNYANQHQFNRNLFINISEPINVSDYATKNAGAGTNAADELTEKIKNTLENLTISIKNDELNQLVNSIEILYKHNLVGKNASLENDFNITQAIVKTVNYYYETDPVYAEKMRLRIINYLANLKTLGLDDLQVDWNKNSIKLSLNNLKSLLLLTIGFPVYLYGLINNFLPFEIPALIANKLKDKDLKGSVAMVLGIFTFTFFYSIFIGLFHYMFHHNWLTLLYAISLPFSGFFCYYYWRWFSVLKAKCLLLILFNKNTLAIAKLMKERNEIISEFEKIEKSVKPF